MRTSFAALALLTSGALLFAACGRTPGVKVVNDLDFEVAFVRCESKSISGADPIFVPAGKEKTIRPGPRCIVMGPTTRSGPLGMNHGEGPYMGCLAMPAYSERAGAKVYLSDLDPDVSWDECDGVE